MGGVIRHSPRPDHVVLAGHTGRLIARAGLLCHTEWEVDEHVIATVLAATPDLGRPITGAELHELWEAAHTTWAQFNPPAPNHLNELLDRVGRAFAARIPAMREALADVNRAAERGAEVIRQMLERAQPHTLDVLPAWMTEAPVQPSDAWAVLG